MLKYEIILCTAEVMHRTHIEATAAERMLIAVCAVCTHGRNQKFILGKAMFSSTLVFLSFSSFFLLSLTAYG